MVRIITAILLSLLLAACDSSPGPLAGSWQSAGLMPMRTTFRAGETESVGIIEKVDYKLDGQSVIVTYKDGLMKGTSVRFVIVAPNKIRAMGVDYQKVGS